MLSFQIKEEIYKILTAFEVASTFFDGLDNINAMSPDIDKFSQTIIRDVLQPHELQNLIIAISKKLTTVKHKIEVKPRVFFATIDKLQSSIRQAKACDFYDLSQLDEIDNSLEQFSLTYEGFLDDYSKNTALTLILEARALAALLDGFKKGLNFYLTNIEYTIPATNDGKELSIYLSSTLSLAEFIQKLQSIERIYKELCMLTDISSPIQILKIESGSLWIKVFGNSKVIDLMTSLVKSGVGFVYRNYTEEGKFAAIPKQVEALESILALRKKLKAAGIAVDELDDHLKKSAVVVSKALNTLIEGQPEIVINDSKLSIGDEAQKKLIEANTPLKLGVDDNS
jgi:hypothetical protein